MYNVFVYVCIFCVIMYDILHSIYLRFYVAYIYTIYMTYVPYIHDIVIAYRFHLMF